MSGADGVTGVVIESGPSDWQILQQGSDDSAEIALTGRWGSDSPVLGVDVRLVWEDSGSPVSAELDWQPATHSDDGTWSTKLQVPAGGLYRIETHLRTEALPVTEWAQRGDMRHFVGVGEVWVIAGQSNSAGYGRGACTDGPELGVHVFSNAMRWCLASHPLNESTNTAHVANRERSNPGHAPWLRFAKELRSALGVPVGLIQTSLGGSPLTAWDPTDGSPAVLYDVMLQAVAAAGTGVRGVLWYQGESDSGPAQAATYAKRFTSAVAAWRKALNNPDLHVLTVQLNRMLWHGTEDQDRGWTMVRQAQREVPAKMANVSVVPAIDLPLSDGIHVSPAGNLLLGERAARRVLSAVYGSKGEQPAPEPRAARAVEDRKVIEVDYDHVLGRIECYDPRAVPFRVEDGEGWVGIEKVEYLPGASHLRLHLARPAGTGAKVHGGYGTAPEMMPCDMPRLMPALAFYDLPVE